MWWLIALLLVAYVAFLAGGFGAFLGWTIENPDLAENTGNNTQLPPGMQLAPLIYSFASSVGYVFPVLLGALAVTGEFRHKTLTPTFLAEPHRSTVLSAKFVSQLIVGAGLGVIAFATSVGTGAAALAAFGLDTELDTSDTWALIGRGVLAMAMWAHDRCRPRHPRHQPGRGDRHRDRVHPVRRADPAPRGRRSTTSRRRSGSSCRAPRAMPSSGHPSTASPRVGSSVTLEWWQGGLVLLAIGTVATIIGGATTWRRDVT